MTQANELIDASTALGVQAAITVTANQYWSPSRLLLIWTTTPTAGNRLPKVTIADAAANVVCEVVTTINLAASLQALYGMLVGAPTTGSFLTPITGQRWTTYGFPGLTLGPGWTINASDTAAVDVADNYTLLLSYGLVNPTLL